MRKILNKIFSSKAFFIVFALFAAIALWMYVTITDVEVQTRTVDHIQFNFSNEDILRGRGLLIIDREPYDLSLTFEAPLNVLSHLNQASVSATVDLINVTDTGLITLDYDIVFPDDVDQNNVLITEESRTQVTLTVDRLSVATIPVVVDHDGSTAAEDLVALSPEFEPQFITVEGPQEILSRIEFARVPVIRENLATTHVDDLSFYFVDIYEDELSEDELDALTTDIDLVHVTIPVIQIRDVQLQVHLIYGAGASEENTNVTITPQYITISGAPEAVREITHVDLGTIVTTAFSTTAADRPRIFLPPHISSESREEYATVLVEIHNVDVRDFQVENLFYTHAPQGYDVRIIPSHVDVRLRGKTGELDDITAMNIRLVADLRDLSVGRHSVPTRVYIDGTDADIGVIGNHTIFVVLSQAVP